ncbi:MAG: DUF1501 domain-containing protein [Bacteroidetes bacterium]|nr:DUF1501 domain-containing protein [Bacteroidota bacterium]
MKRKQFIRDAGAGVLLPALLSGFSLRAFGASPLLEALAQSSVDTDHVLVLIQLNGGNDGLNTVIPIDQYSELSNARSNILIPQNQVLSLSGLSGTGLHPAMTGLQSLFNDGKVRIVQGVSYPNPNYSHFRATDIWMTASDANQSLTSGWAGRYLNYEYPNFPTGYPNTQMPDPLAIQIGSVMSTVFQGPASGMGMSISDPTNFYNLVNGIQSPAPATPAGFELSYIRQVAQQTDQYAGVITAAANSVTQQNTYPSNNSLAAQLKIVAQLIAGGLKTRIYMVSMGGFDNHSNQVVAGNTATGTHATLLQELSDAVKAFMDDLTYLNIANRVMGMTFSEFGRRIISNNSLGTDHGAAAPMLIFGNQVMPGMLGTNPVIPAAALVSDNIAMQYDFRSVYASLLQDWFCVPNADLNTILLQNFQTLPLVNGTDCSAAALHQINQSAGLDLLRIYPNPMVTTARVSYTTMGGHILLQLFNCEGQVVKTLLDREMAAGSFGATLENENYPAGVYYVRLQNQSVQQVKPVVVARG